MLSGGSLISSSGTATINTSASATLVNGGTFPAGSTPTITIDSPSNGSTATATALFQLQGIANLNGGIGYSSAPAVTITAAPAGGVSALATTTLGITNSSIAINAAGTNYKTGDVLKVLVGTTSYGGTIVVTSVNGTGGINGYQVVAPGTGYSSSAVPSALSGGSGTGATILGSANEFQVANRRSLRPR